MAWRETVVSEEDPPNRHDPTDRALRWLRVALATATGCALLAAYVVSLIQEASSPWLPVLKTVGIAASLLALLAYISSSISNPIDPTPKGRERHQRK